MWSFSCRAGSLVVVLSCLAAAAGVNIVASSSGGAGGSVLQSVVAKGGYASEVFWYPTFQDSPATFGTNVVHDDITMLLADSQSRIDKRLVVAVDQRPTVGAIEPPEGTWSLEPGAEGVAVLSDDVLVAQGGVGTARAIFTTTDGDSKLAIVPFRSARAGTVLFKPFEEIAGTFRHGVSTNVIAHFAAANTNAISTYRFHRETSHGETGSSTWTFPNCFQLYEAGGVNTDAPNPRAVNETFFWPEVADALRCVSSWRGDWYAHRPFIAIAPHYGISVAHWRQTNTWVPWCVDRDAGIWMTNRLASTGHEDPGRVGTVADVSVHRFTEAFPTNILMRFLPQSRLAALSPSLLNSSLGMTASSHNTVHPEQLRPSGGPLASSHRTWRGYEVVGNVSQWLPRSYGGVDALTHNVHLWDSGHLSFFFINGVLVPVGTFTFANGGGNALMNDTIINRIAEIIVADSGGAETVGLIAVEELQ